MILPLYREFCRSMPVSLALGLLLGLLFIGSVQADVQNDFDRAKAAAESGDCSTAVTYYSKVIDILEVKAGSKLLASMLLNRAICLNALSQYKPARDDLNRSIRLNGTEPKAFFHRGVTRLNLGFSRQAVDDFSRSISNNTHLHRSYLYRGLAWSALSDFPNAIRDFESANSLDPHNFLGNYNLGLAYFFNDNPASAVNSLSTALRLSPDSGDAYFVRGQAYKLLGDNENSAKDLENATKYGHQPSLLKIVK